jgi:hypothetical protein
MVHAPTPPPPLVIRYHRATMGDGQTNWIKFIAFVCPLQSSTTIRVTMVTDRRIGKKIYTIRLSVASPCADAATVGHPLPSSNHGDGQTIGIKFIPFAIRLSLRPKLSTIFFSDPFESFRQMRRRQKKNRNCTLQLWDVFPILANSAIVRRYCTRIPMLIMVLIFNAGTPWRTILSAS